MDHQEVGLRLGIARELGGGVRRRVIEGDRQRLALDLLGARALLQGGELVVLRLGPAVVALGERLYVLAQGSVGLVQLAVLTAALMDEVGQLQQGLSVRILVPLAVLKLVKKMRPARAKTAAVRIRTGRKRRARSGVDPVPGESAELLNVPLSPSAPRKHYANGRPGEHSESPYAAPSQTQF